MQAEQGATHLPMDVIEGLYQAKRAEVRKAEELLRRLREELQCLEHYRHIVVNPDVKFSWTEFVEFVRERSSEAAEVLLRSEATDFDVGKLRLRASGFDHVFLSLHRERIREWLKESQGIAFIVEVIDGGSGADRGRG